PAWRPSAGHGVGFSGWRGSHGAIDRDAPTPRGSIRDIDTLFGNGRKELASDSPDLDGRGTPYHANRLTRPRAIPGVSILRGETGRVRTLRPVCEYDLRRKFRRGGSAPDRSGEGPPRRSPGRRGGAGESHPLARPARGRIKPIEASSGREAGWGGPRGCERVDYSG